MDKQTNTREQSNETREESVDRFAQQIMDLVREAYEAGFKAAKEQYQ